MEKTPEKPISPRMKTRSAHGAPSTEEPSTPTKNSLEASAEVTPLESTSGGVSVPRVDFGHSRTDKADYLDTRGVELAL